MSKSPETLLAIKLPLLQRMFRFWQRLGVSSRTDTGAQRWRRIYISLGRSLCSRAVAMVCSLLMIPLALRYLGAERYGVWVTLTSLVSMLSFFDFGIGIGLQNRVAEMMGKSRLEEAGDVLRSTFVVLAAISLALFCLSAVVILRTDFSSMLFGAPAFAQVDVNLALIVIVGAFVLGLPLGLFSRMAFGLQQGWIASVATSTGSVLSLLAVAVAALLRLDFLAFVALTVCPPLLAQGISYALLSRHVPGRLSLRGPVFIADGVDTLREGSRYVLPLVGGVIVNQSPLVLLGTLSSPVHAAIYSVFIRISLPLQQLQQMFLEQVWPAITEALHRGDATWLRDTLRRVLRMNVAFAAMAFLAVALAVHLLFPLLTRSAGLEPSASSIYLYALQVGVMCVVQVFAYMANGLARPNLQNYFALICIPYVFTALPYAAGRLGIDGILLALIALNGLVALPLYFADHARYLRRLEASPAPRFQMAG